VAQVARAFEQEHLADVRDAAQLRKALHHAQPEVVFHLAAQPLVRASYADPLETFSTNVMGTANLLDAARQAGSVRAVLVVTSDKCYREQDRPHAETDPLGGHDPYSASKACAELVTDSFRAAYGMPAQGIGVATVRAGNVVGGGDWTADRLMPDLLACIDRGQPVHLRRPAAVRPWQHVLEPLAGYLLLAERLLDDAAAYSGAWNFGPDEGQAQPVLTVVERLLALAADSGLALPAPVIGAAAANLHEAAVLRLDASKAQRQLGWQGRLDLAASLRWTWQWHQAWREGNPMHDTTLRQIRDYQALTSS
jgi:CDP-glucose 4,6-dehydratase